MTKSVTFIASVLLSTSLFAQDDIFKASWLSSPVKVDGNAKEWKQPFNYYDASSKLFFAFANDDKNLYLCFQSPDEMNQMKIMHAGMKVTLTIKSKDKHKVMIAFPMEHKATETALGKEKPGEKKISPSDMKYGFLVQNTMMEVKGFAAKSGIIPINDTSGINAAINWDEANKFTYELAIPLKELYGNAYTPEDLTKDILMDAEVNAVKKQSHPEGGGPGGLSGRDGKMGGGGSMGGRHRQNNTGDESNAGQISGERGAIFEKGLLKQKFVLALKQ